MTYIWAFYDIIIGITVLIMYFTTSLIYTKSRSLAVVMLSKFIVVAGFLLLIILIKNLLEYGGLPLPIGTIFALFQKMFEQV